MTGIDLTEYRVLKVWSEMFFDAQEARKRLANRIRFAPVFPEIFAAELAVAEQSEHRIGLALVRQYRRSASPGVIAWQKESKGIGEHLLARLLGHLGHPRVATPSHWEGLGSERKLVADEPFERSVSQLWQYCGHGRPGRVQKGMTAEELAGLGNPDLKMLVHLLAECSIKEPGRDSSVWQTTRQSEPTGRAPARQDLSLDQAISDIHMRRVEDRRSVEQAIAAPASMDETPAQPTDDTADSLIGVPILTSNAAGWPYRRVYEERRILTADREHAVPCVRCGPSGHPAMPGTPWSKAHAHADALRIVGKHMLRDLWVASEL